jgi:hypothetical protein
MNPQTSWRTVSDAKVVYVPLGMKPTKDGEEKMSFARTGIRIEMEDGSWWFFRFQSKTWSRHYPGSKVVGKGFNASNVAIEHKDDGLTENALKRTWGHAPWLLTALKAGVQLALAAEAEKRAASRAA